MVMVRQQEDNDEEGGKSHNNKRFEPTLTLSSFTEPPKVFTQGLPLVPPWALDSRPPSPLQGQDYIDYYYVAE